MDNIRSTLIDCLGQAHGYLLTASGNGLRGFRPEMLGQLCDLSLPKGFKTHQPFVAAVGPSKIEYPKPTIKSRVNGIPKTYP